ncbi:hypothetical protein [Streptomyces uncialis]|uniref:hypothetical protein n=1 Tax=Streptomyces uncialis TaxID=1048205 RepID=UPI00340D6B27
MTGEHTGRGLEMFRAGDLPPCMLTFARSLSPLELLTRMAADQETLVLRDGVIRADRSVLSPRPGPLLLG